MNRWLVRTFFLVAASAGWLAPASPVQADERYFLLVFSAESKPYRAKYTHTWATIVKLTGEGDDLNAYGWEVDTCSWLPATLDIKVWKTCAEQGVNLDLHSTVLLMLKNGSCVSEWGPYEVRKDLYERGLCQIQRLNSGVVRYRAVDGLSPERNISNCFHAISDLDPEYGRRRYPLLEAGDSVTYDIIDRVRERNPDARRSPLGDWVNQKLGLDEYPIRSRLYGEGRP